MASVPKGFLRHRVLQMLNEKPMSGSEIMSEIGEQTDGFWRPSPGSIYPLLAWLQDKGYIREAAEQEAGMKRYTLTAQGKAFLKEQVKTREERRRRHRGFMHCGPAFMGPMWFEFRSEEAKELRRAARNLDGAMWDLRDGLRRNYSEEVAEEARKALEGAAKKIEDSAKKLRK